MGLLKPDADKKLVFGRHVRYNGKQYKYGDDIPDVDKLDHRYIEKMYRNGVFIHPRNASTVSVKEEPVKTEDFKQEEPVTERDEDVAKVVVDTDESFQVEYQGKVREIKRNQLREDGSLTSGGLKAFKD